MKPKSLSERIFQRSIIAGFVVCGIATLVAQIWVGSDGFGAITVWITAVVSLLGTMIGAALLQSLYYKLGLKLTVGLIVVVVIVYKTALVLY